MWNFMIHFINIPKINSLFKSVVIEDVSLEASLYTMILLRRPNLDKLIISLEAESDTESKSVKDISSNTVFEWLGERDQLEAGLWQLINNKDSSYLRKNNPESIDQIKTLLIKLKSII